MTTVVVVVALEVVGLLLVDRVLLVDLLHSGSR